MVTTRKRRGKPCSVCGRWFTPNPRVGRRQRTCGDAACRKEQKRRTQAAWARRNRHYWRQRRLDAQVDRLEAGADPSLRPPPAALARIPPEAAQEALGTKGVVFMAFLLRVLLATAQEAMEVQRDAINQELRRIQHEGAQEAIGQRGRGS